jgi:adenine-specific DNA-methyltransferase
METINDYMPLSNDWNNERLQILKQQFPDWFTSEGNLNIDEVKKAVNPDTVNETERYEFRWFGKSQAKRNAFTPSNATLVYDEERSVNPNDSENLIIEGENLEVLKLLSGSYREKIKCIYIDPPYNTGKDFVYSDNFTQDKKGYWEDAEVLENGLKIDTNTDTDGRYHSNWLNMMYSRLLMSRQLLKEDGIIFISIDDNEVHHLRKICDEIFGEENFVGCIVRTTGQTTGQESEGLGSSFDYLLVYSKNTERALNGLPLTEHDLKRFENEDEKGKYAYDQMRKTGSNDKREDRPNMYYSILNPDNEELFPIGPGGYESRWRFEKKTYDKLVEDGFILWKKTKKEDIEIWWPYVKYYLEGRTKRPSPLWDDLDGNKKAARDLRSLFDGKKIFDFPKPVQLLERIISISCDSNDNDIILDFFGGSGSTGEAVFSLNKKDKGNRKYILVQVPEIIDEKSEAFNEGFKKISDITIERNKRVIDGIAKELIEQKKKKGQELPFGMVAEPVNAEYQTTNIKSKTGLGFKVFKLQKSNFPRVDFAPDPELDDVANLELLKKYIADKESQLVNAFNKEELMTEILLKNNFSLNYTTIPQEQFTKNEIVFATDGEKETLICLDVFIAPETVDYFKANTNQKFICLERALDTTKKYNLKHYLGDKFNAF